MVDIKDCESPRVHLAHNWEQPVVSLAPQLVISTHYCYGRQQETDFYDLVKKERERQIDDKGYTVAHDENHGLTKLLGFSIYYAARGEQIKASAVVKAAMDVIATYGEFDANGYFEDEPEPEQSNLVDHARRELELLGEDEDVIDWYIRVIRVFNEAGHSGGSASIAIPTLNDLLQFKNLKPLTDDPAEWMHHTEEVWGEPGGVWQNIRNGEAFSSDGGKTYYILSELHNEVTGKRPVHESSISGKVRDDQAVSEEE